MKISYGITVCDEDEELNRLLHHLHPLIDEEDQIIILRDVTKTNSQVTKCIEHFKTIAGNPLISVESKLDNNFASFKNNLLRWTTGDYLFQLDADEIPNDFLIENIKQVLHINRDIDCFNIPRINTVSGLKLEHIKKWGWNINEQNQINFPDPQMRLFKLNRGIKWIKPVHEILDGYETVSTLPYDTEDFCLYHHKTIVKQEKQNNYYDTL